MPAPAPADLPAGVVAHVGTHLAAGDRAALACAARCFASAHHAVVEEDAWPHPERARPLPDDPGRARARARVALLVRSLPGLRTLRVGPSMHGEAREFLGLGGGRTVRFACIFHAEESSAEVARDFPGRTGAEVVHLLSSADSGMVELLGHLASVDCLVIAQWQVDRTYGAGVAERNARQLVASIPWAGIRRVRLALVDRGQEETAALLALIPAPISALRVSAAGFFGLRDILARVRAKPPDEARALLARIADVEVDDCTWSDESVGCVFDAVPVIASLPEACSVSFVGPICRDALAVPLVQEILAPDGGRRGLVRIVCGDSQWWTGSAPSVSPYVQAAAACVGEPRRLRTVDARGRALECPGGLEAALERLRSHPDTAGVAALWRRMGTCSGQAGHRGPQTPGRSSTETAGRCERIALGVKDAPVVRTA